MDRPLKRNRRAKIVATLGPATHSQEMIRKLTLSGVDVFRFNFSHGTHEDHAERFRAVRAVEAEFGRPIGILQDLQGPKIRIGVIGDDRALADGSTVRFVLDEHAVTPGEGETVLPLPHAQVFEGVLPGHLLMIDDGRLRLRVSACESDSFTATVEVGGIVKNRKGVNLPDTPLSLSAMTDKDREDLAFGLELGVDFVALSFVQRPADLIEARQILASHRDTIGSAIDPYLVAKIEKPAALDQFRDIVHLADAIMVARGDLGVEIPPEDVPARQKEIIRACRLAAKPVIVATQMLDSMERSPAPTRAEASDVATAIYDGASAVMLSGETAAGAYPVESVAMMDRIVQRTEQHEAYMSIIRALEPEMEATPQHVIASAASKAATDIKAAVIVAFTSKGTTTCRISRERPPVNILSITPNMRVARQLALVWGAHSVCSEEISSFQEMVEKAITFAKAEGFAKPQDDLVVIAGVPFGRAGSTNNLRIVTVPG